MRKIMLMMLLLAGLTTLFSPCKASSQSTDGPPTEAEIAEFRRTHPVDEIDYEPMGSMARERPDNLARDWGDINIILLVEIIGDLELDDFSAPYSLNRHIYNYRAKIVEIISRYSKITNFVVVSNDDEVYLRFPASRPAALYKNEKYIIAARIYDDTRNGQPIVRVGPSGVYYITDGKYIIDMVEAEDFRSHTGKSLFDFKNELATFSRDELGWEDIASTFNTTAHIPLF